MNKHLRRTLWGTLITIFSLIILVVGAIAIILNFVFTPAKITPLVTRLANENLNAKLSLSSVDITFFTTFPNFALVIEDGALLSIDADTLLKSDTIVAFKRCEVNFNPIALLKENRVEVRKIELLKPTIYAAVLPDGRANWDILKSVVVQSDRVVADTTSSKKLALSLSGIRINEGTLIFDNRPAGLYMRCDSVAMSLDGDLAAMKSNAKFMLSFKNALLWQDEKLLFKKVDFRTDADVVLDAVTKQLSVNRAEVAINGVHFVLKGDATPDRVDVKLALKVASLESVLELVSFLDKSAKVTTKGEVAMNVHLFGGYRNGAVPVMDAELSVVDASLRYQGYQYGIDKLDLKADAHLDLSRKTDSYLNISDFKMKGASTSIDLYGSVNQILTNPQVYYITKSTVNMTELAATFPLADSIEIAGKIDVDSNGGIYLNQLRKGDYAHINANGRVSFDKVRFVVPGRINSRFERLNLHLSNTKEGLLSFDADLAVVDVDLKNGGFKMMLDSAMVSASGIKKRDSTSYLKGKFAYSDLKASLYRDTLSLSSGRSNVGFQLSQTATLTFSTDTLTLRALDSRFSMSSANVDVVVGKKLLKGKIGFSEIDLSTPLFPLSMSMPATVVKVDNQDIMLEKAAFRLGNSDLIMTGIVRNLLSAARKEAVLEMKVDVGSTMLDLTQIAHTLNQMEKGSAVLPDTTATVVDTTSVAVNLFKVPRGIDFDLNTSFRRVEFGKLLMDDVHGAVTLKDGVARLEDLSLHTLGATLATTVVYDSRESDKYAKVGLMLRSKSIDVHSVIELMPSLDTLMPMLNSFEGKLDFSLMAATKFYDGFTINPKDIKAAVALSGEGLVLLDGKTFSEISKMLMFKNKKRNVVDSVSVQLAVDDGAVEVFPFIIQIDRYRAAIGGQHYMNNNFNYHISILKSPIPFKFGINITGSLDDMKVGIGKTQYKFLNKPNYVKQLNPKFIEVGKEIREQIKKI